jgi:hypothetical protein
MWRKNREINAGTSCIGVDLNRNYNYHWIGPGSTSGPCTETYRGPSAFSEPETQHLRDFINAHANIHMILSIHTYQKLVLYPWGYTYDPIADQTDFLAYRTLAEAMAKLNGYTPTQASGLYITNGDSDDWEYGAKGIFAFTFELEPGQLDPLGFYPPPSIIPGACKRNFEAIKLMIGLSRDPHLAVSAELWRLEATLHGHAATIHWNSVIESTPKGWNVLRAIGSSENYQPINSKLIKAGQADYQFVDDGLADGETYQYKVEFVSQYPSANVQFGPVSVTVGGGDDDVSPDDDATDDDAADDDNAATDDDQSAGGDDSGGCGC